jgi:hypothetical protein
MVEGDCDPRSQKLEPDIGQHVLDQINSHRKYDVPKTTNLFKGLGIVDTDQSAKQSAFSPRGEGKGESIIKLRRR